MATTHNKTPLPILGNGAGLSACWSCGEMRAAHFCDACGKVQPPFPTDYFSFFGLPRKLDLDLTALERDFYRLSRNLHPDLFGRASAREQQWSLEKSSQLNDAYRTLKDPIARTEYLLRIEGVRLEEQSQAATHEARAAGKGKKQAVPPDLLEEVFELNLQLEEFRTSKKMGEPDAELIRGLQSAKARFEDKLAALADELEQLWHDWDGLPFHESPEPSQPSPQRTTLRDQMVDVLNRRKYVQNLVAEIGEELDNL